MRTTKRLKISLGDRRKWEQRIASVLAERRVTDSDSATRRFERIYKERRFTPVESRAPEAPAVGAVVSQPSNAKVLTAAFLGPQNSGKSSLVNALAHTHISVESKRSGSTTSCCRAVATVHDTQLTLVDTPGIVQVRAPRDRKRHAAAALLAWETLFAADLVVATLAAGLGFVEPEHKSILRDVVRRAAQRQLPVVVAITKMDKVQTPRQREMYFSMRSDLEATGVRVARFHETSVKDSKGLVELKDLLCRYATPGNWTLYRNEQTPLTPKERVAQLLQQVLMDILPHEIPHEMRHRIIGWTVRDSGSVEVVAEVFFARPAYLFTFYSKLEAISVALQRLAEQELQKKFFFVFQGFITPGGISASRK